MSAILLNSAKATAAGATDLSIQRRQPACLDVLLGLQRWGQLSNLNIHGAIRPVECDGRAWGFDESTWRGFLLACAGLRIGFLHLAEAAVQLARLGLNLGFQIFMIRLNQTLSVRLESADLLRVLAGISQNFERLYWQGLNIWSPCMLVRFRVFLTIDRLGGLLALTNPIANQASERWALKRSSASDPALHCDGSDRKSVWTYFRPTLTAGRHPVSLGRSRVLSVFPGKPMHQFHTGGFHVWQQFVQ